jgi:hypothetical protein
VLGGPAAAALAAQDVGEIHRQDSTEQNDIHQHLKISKHLGTSSSWKFFNKPINNGLSLLAEYWIVRT